MTLISSSRHLPQVTPDAPIPAHRSHNGLRLTDLHAGQSARITRVGMLDANCRKRLAELGIAEGSRITVVGNSGGQIMLQLGGSKMALGVGCAAEISVLQLPAPSTLTSK